MASYKPPTYDMDPDAVLDFPMNWADYLPEGDVITASTWTAEEGVTVDDDTEFTDTSTTVWLSGAEMVAGTKYRVTNHVVTQGGREDDRSIIINCKEF